MLMVIVISCAGLVVAAAQSAKPTPEVLWTFEAGG
jgi:hypothetical protein